MSEIDRLIRSGRVIAKKDGRRTVIERRELDRFADRLPTMEPKHGVVTAGGLYEHVFGIDAATRPELSDPTGRV
ncbi:hypothetical protein TS71_20630 [Mycolicibacterium neoaurum]|uniref:Uncharacterized protein n=1 Tax=Mycolicibacterium neoaurum VKM Ac-1815D TaxID=700508 RepID=V5X742_MYCNE|nr:hypothetical protein [Mycolicibacterium neoaurum]AMO04497.1 hypothetical protein MyAD_04050 [Mycolicibacterium neoaurum]AXK77216.1 hypothetical protein DXK33_21075 [Mycolicibacterium neoaurum]KJQ48520.1 hypothetical protein TS71_20630 [Mycolicibacterium neoaurum]KUM06906.1 hypothetical protein AVZ31_18800 [Mycolicibacterium neoaurum]